MRKHRVETRQLGPAQLRILLTLARDLLQTDEAQGSLALIGRALAEMVRFDSALLLLRSDRMDLVEFDSHGIAHSVGTAHPLYRAAVRMSADAVAAADVQSNSEEQLEYEGARRLVLAVPAQAAAVVLAVSWNHDVDTATQEAYKRTLSYVLQLAGAALGKIESHTSLERLLREQRQEIVDTSVTHAKELRQRDEAVSEMRMLSLTDMLTGLYNRRGFFLQAEQIYKLARRRRTKSAVIFADIDGLKRVNDELGHEAGDAMIRDAALVFRQSFRHADVVARLGGDEFVAYTLDDEQPEVILSRIEANLRAFNLMQERPYCVSISAGVVLVDSSAEQTLSHYVLLADEQMYAQKRSRLH
ncbi:GGDEF domain-containing protein [Massilia endophytica]|uniref:GGDEF domain-containing protein n=1 Tax=Massilia endophytica TaxID=2899220 RepID=UPI001E2FA765|nr:GGDEF domain-containing protein [Massilia endophytica]UGQ48818.1 GGDEF domain-containing protein [Massilia endophytica]